MNVSDLDDDSAVTEYLRTLGAELAVVGRPVVFAEDDLAEARAAVADPDPPVVARTVLRWRPRLERMLRVTFCFAGVDPRRCRTPSSWPPPAARPRTDR